MVSPTAERRPRRRSRQDVLDAALGLLDQHGLPDLTMRALGRELDVQPSALYWHFENKQTLLAAIADAILDPVGDTMVRNPAEVAQALRSALLAVTDGAEVVISTIALGLGADRAFLRLRDSLLAEGATPAAATQTATTLVHFCLGHVSHEQQRLQAERLGVTPARSPIHADEGSFSSGVARILATTLATVVEA